jgi:hypothetical protein
VEWTRRQIKMNKAEKLDGIVADYINEHRERAAKELRWFAIQRILEEAVRRFSALRRLCPVLCPASN